MSAPKRLSLPNRCPTVAAVSTRPRPFTMGVYPLIPLRVMVGRSPAVLVTRFTEPPIPSASMLAWRGLLISTDSTMSGIQLDLAHARFRRRHVDAINGDACEPGLGTTDLHVLAFAFVALQSNARQTAKGISHIGIGQT